MTETGPIYGRELIKTLPLGSSGMLQACPTRADLEQVAEVNLRTAAAYEVLLGHYQRLERENRELRGRLIAEDTDIADDPEYQQFVQEQAKHCRCSHGPCDGVLAGGPCDEMDLSEDKEDEPDVCDYVRLPHYFNDDQETDQ